MVYQFSCPHCGGSLYFANRQQSDEDFQESLCRCRMLFALQQLDLIEIAKEVSNASEGPLRRHRSRTQYEVMALDAEGRRIHLQFSGVLTDSQQPLSVWPDDRLLLLHSVRDRQIHQLVRVRSVGSSEVFVDDAQKAGELEIATMRWHCWAQRLKAGGVASAISVAMALPLQEFGNPMYWAAAVVTVTTVAGLAGWGDRFRLRDRTLLRRLDGEQNLLRQQYAMEQKQACFSQRLRQQRRLLKRLLALKRCMQTADATLYAHRIGVVDRGIATLKESTGLTKSLRDGYRQLVKMLAIEYETSRLAEQFPDNSTQEIVQRVRELEAMEERRSTLEALIDPQLLLKAI